MLFSLAYELYTVPQSRSVASLVVCAIFAGFSVASVFYGLPLWRGRDFSRLPSAAIWLAQIPFIVSSTLTYSVALGISIRLQLQLVAKAAGLIISFGVQSEVVGIPSLSIAGQQPIIAAGINVIAAWFCWLLFAKPLNAR
jgi:hypothetical protein